MKLFTIGHSTRDIDSFCSLLSGSAVSMLADVRSYPSSRRHPQFNQSCLSDSLEAKGIAYLHLIELGGRRSVGAAPSPNRGLRVKGFQNYADHMLSAEFRTGIETLLQLAGQRVCSILCAEAFPYSCHRRLISDYVILVHGVEVVHIMDNRLEPHRVTPFALVHGSAVLYPESQASLFD